MAVNYTIKKPYVVTVVSAGSPAVPYKPSHCTYNSISYTASQVTSPSSIGISYSWYSTSSSSNVTVGTSGSGFWGPTLPKREYIATGAGQGVSYSPYSTTTATTSYSSSRYVVSSKTCTPAVQGSPAVPAQLADLTTYAWDSGARSDETFVGDGYIEFQAPENPKGVVIGLGYINQSTLYTDIRYGFYFLGSKYYLVVDGKPVGAAQDSVPETLHHVVINGSRVEFFVGSSFVYATDQTLIPEGEKVFVDISLYGPDDGCSCTILSSSVASSPLISETITLAGSAKIDATFEGEMLTNLNASADMLLLASFANEVVGYSNIVSGASMTFGTPLIEDTPEGSATLVGTARVAGIHPDNYINTMTLGALTSFAYDYDYGRSDQDLPNLTGFSTGGFVIPELVGTSFLMPSLFSYGTMLTGTITVDNTPDVTLPVIDGLSSETVYGEAASSLPALTTLSFQSPVFDGYMYTEAPLFESYAVVRQEPENGSDIVLLAENFPFESYLGDEAVLTAPEFTFSGDATFPIVGRFEADFSFDVEASGLTGGVASLNVELDLGVSFISYEGGGAALTSPLFSVLSSGLTGGVASVSVSFAATLDADVTDEVFAQAELEFPEFVSMHGVSYMTAPAFVLNVEGGEVVVRPTTAYVSHLDADAEVTQYTNYDFDCVVRFMGRYYGIKADGMYLLEGANDNGSDIAVNIKSQEFDFGTARKKRIPYLYAGSDQNFTVTPYVDGVNFGTYTSTLGEERVYLPQGATGRYWQIEYNNIQGNDFALDSVGLVVNVLRRIV